MERRPRKDPNDVTRGRGMVSAVSRQADCPKMRPGRLMDSRTEVLSSVDDIQYCCRLVKSRLPVDKPLSSVTVNLFSSKAAQIPSLVPCAGKWTTSPEITLSLFKYLK